MDEPRIELRLPDGRAVMAGPDAIVGRSSVAAVHLDDPRISTVHAELSWRAEGFLLIARGGRLRVGGRAVREVALADGMAVELAPHVVLEVVRVVSGAASVVPPTAGRDCLRFRVAEGRVEVRRGRATEPSVCLTGVVARLVTELLGDPEPRRWDAVAEAVWRDDGALRRRLREEGRTPGGWTAVDERRLRNRWDQALRSLRTALEPLQRPQLVDVAGGTVQLRLGPADRVERGEAEDDVGAGRADDAGSAGSAEGVELADE